MLMSHRALIRLAALGIAVSTSGCTRPARSDSSRPPLAVETSVVSRSDVSDALEVVGALGAKRRADIKSEYSGIVSAVDVHEWVPVRRGQPLARLDAREAETIVASARAALLQAEVGQARAVRELERAESLKEVGLLTRQGLEEAQTARDAAAAALAAARAQLAAAQVRLDKTVLRAPFDGVVAARNVDVGDRVESMGNDRPMFTIVDDRRLDLTMTVPSARLSEIALGQNVSFTVDVFPDRTFDGRITHVNPSVDVANRAGRVVAEVANDRRPLRGGLFAKARIYVGTRSVVQVPRVALRNWDVTTGSAEVFVIEGDTAQLRPIRTGAPVGDAVEVASGLRPGEQVATRGAFNLRAGDRVRRVGTTG